MIPMKHYDRTCAILLRLIFILNLRRDAADVLQT